MVVYGGTGCIGRGGQHCATHTVLSSIFQILRHLGLCIREIRNFEIPSLCICTYRYKTQAFYQILGTLVCSKWSSFAKFVAKTIVFI